MLDEFQTLLAQLMPPEEQSVSKGRSRKGLASKKKQAQRKNLLREFESEIAKWLSSVSAAVAVEAAKNLNQAANSDETGFGLSLGKRVARDAAIQQAAESLGAFASQRAISQLFFHSQIPSLLANQSRGHRNAGAARNKRKGKAYRRKIETVLMRNPALDFEGVIATLEKDDWIIQSDDGWTVATESDERGGPSDAAPYEFVSKASMQQAVSRTRGEVKNQKNG